MQLANIFWLADKYFFEAVDEIVSGLIANCVLIKI